ncbi:hypothetical protein EHI8A_128300 [Entamoeba histolytica HM-1:IMSS-B]|uniref:Sin1 middle CRIM domain-containing protein n=6 Tax=Entamoeba histolytica TaxID=5759 RepID=C4M7C2_ENTH1|nr:hypothetical protein EHI_007280 [Entamoeba histolytica HM-1:IMSS]EMD43212.1 Hypothetical protein EHI5A_161930 [Entamoeba histolytica KU27]EMH72123.1 hypothetical protein EHI8A_128300 [Entamoeba histolytica HM-1:IMSS-B]EMS12503.1 hypothetical protein KM1_207320 [Entamoeba histolytica HM-3:IMSS]ENY59775.1 hypothetical protein EHI7A_116870 [Entamoeba histolytica HM-1:IMSS-A]GAT97425.1 hypothetical protein CL6EHI_007280 [Entamoeba histolytica]|eukprot:XP_650278.1 hypothetical protein EHI_007280 [Entamoeba histolytica HM-1:IMSS]
MKEEKLKNGNMNNLVNYISEDQLVKEIGLDECMNRLNLKNNILMRKTECLVSLNDFENILENVLEKEKKNIVLNDKKVEGVEQKKQTEKEIDLLFQVQPIPRLPNPRRVKTGIQFKTYFIHFTGDFVIPKYSFSSSPNTSIEQFIKLTINKVNKQLEEENQNNLFLRETYESYLLRISDENGVADDDLPPLEYSSKIGEMGSSHFVLVDNPDYFDKVKKHRRVLNNSNSGMSAFLNTKNAKVFFKIKKMEGSTARYGYKDNTTVEEFLSSVIDERNKKYNLNGTEFELSKDLNNYEFKMADENGIPDDDFDVVLNSNISTYGDSFVLIGKGKYQTNSDASSKQTIFVVPPTKGVSKEREIKKEQRTSLNNKSSLFKRKKDDEIVPKPQLSPRQNKGKTIIASPRKKPGKIYTVFYQTIQLKIEYDETGTVGGFIDEVLIYAFRNGIKLNGKNASDFSIYIAEPNGECDRDFEINKESQIKDMCSMFFGLYSKQ